MSDIGNTNWEGIPNTDSAANCSSLRNVVDAMVISVENAQIRSATVSGVFEIADVPNPFRIDNGDLRVEVKCLWHDRKPSDSWMHLAISNKYEFIRRYTGQVVKNIS
jgi:hypothetical protein